MASKPDTRSPEMAAVSSDATAFVEGATGLKLIPRVSDSCVDYHGTTMCKMSDIKKAFEILPNFIENKNKNNLIRNDIIDYILEIYNLLYENNTEEIFYFIFFYLFPQFSIFSNNESILFFELIHQIKYNINNDNVQIFAESLYFIIINKIIKDRRKYFKYQLRIIDKILNSNKFKNYFVKNILDNYLKLFNSIFMFIKYYDNIIKHINNDDGFIIFYRKIISENSFYDYYDFIYCKNNYINNEDDDDYHDDDYQDDDYQDNTNYEDEEVEYSCERCKDKGCFKCYSCERCKGIGCAKCLKDEYGNNPFDCMHCLSDYCDHCK